MPRASRRTRPLSAAIAVVALGCAWPGGTSAQPAPALEAPAAVTVSLTVMLARAPFESVTPPRVGLVAPLGTHRAVDRAALRRPGPLPALYVSFGVLQGLDIHSTLTAVSAGGREANPVVKGLVARPAAMVGAKLAGTAGTLFLTERLWKKHRAAAVALMVAVNAAYAMIVVNNYRARPRS